MRRIPWNIVLALVAGIGLGLVYAWMIAPLNVTDADPGTLRADFKDQYRSAIAAAYAATGNLPRAQSRLKLLQDPDPVAVLNAQAQRMLARGESSQAVDQVAALAQALQEMDSDEPVPASNPATASVSNVMEAATATFFSPPTDLAFLLTDTPLTPIESETLPAVQPTSRPSKTPVSTQGAPYKLTGQDEVCDPSLPDGLLQVFVLSANRRQLPGIRVDITWQGETEQFFTGLKPELGGGYADFIMTPDVSYTVQLAAGSDIATGLTAPSCQTSSGETFHGGIKLTFQQP